MQRHFTYFFIYDLTLTVTLDTILVVVWDTIAAYLIPSNGEIHLTGKASFDKINSPYLDL
jgi:hypothetical protein